MEPYFWYTCDSVWPGHAFTLRWLSLTLVEMKFAHIKASFWPFGHPTQVNASWMMSINLLLANEIEDSLRLGGFFFWRLVCTCLATQRKSPRKFNLRPLATSCRPVRLARALWDFECLLSVFGMINWSMKMILFPENWQQLFLINSL